MPPRAQREKKAETCGQHRNHRNTLLVPCLHIFLGPGRKLNWGSPDGGEGKVGEAERTRDLQRLSVWFRRDERVRSREAWSPGRRGPWVDDSNPGGGGHCWMDEGGPLRDGGAGGVWAVSASEKWWEKNFRSLSLSMYTYIYTSTHTYMHLYIYTCVHTYIHLYIYTYMHIYIHIYL